MAQEVVAGIPLASREQQSRNQYRGAVDDDDGYVERAHVRAAPLANKKARDARGPEYKGQGVQAVRR
jgi:hypothetical protein